MPELPMASALAHLSPAVRLEYRNDFVNLFGHIPLSDLVLAT